MKLAQLPIGTKFGSLTLLEHLPLPKYGIKTPIAKWRCDCGKAKKIRIYSVTGGYTRSCGCSAQKAMRGLAMAHSNEVLR